jgi:TonB-dependent SusC/RagA subfamily outer membrane receptor
MKHLFLLICLVVTVTLTAQEYQKKWEKVLEFETEGLIKSAAEETDKIYAQAKKDKNEPQVIKAFFFKSKYLQELDELAQLKIIANIQAEIKTATPPTAAFLESLYGEMLKEIYDKNRYNISKRSDTEGILPTNFLEWTTANFKAEIANAYELSIRNRDVLYKTPLSNYEAVINFNPVLAKTKRSLYDFLVERYLQAYNDEDNKYINNDKFTAETAALLFGTTQAFISLKLPDSLQPGFARSITLCQDTERFYTTRDDNYSLQRAVLRRLEYANNNLSIANKANLQLNTLTTLAQLWGKSPFAYRAILRQAIIYREFADKKNNPTYLKKAVALCDIIIADKSNDVQPEAINLKNQIISPKLQLQTQKYVSPNRPLLGSISFQNIDAVTVQIYKLTKAEAYKAQKDNYKIDYTASKPFLTKKYTLPNKQDYFDYTTEIILPPLPAGFYIITFNSPAINLTEKQFHDYNLIQVSQIALTYEQHDKENVFQALDRDSGEPIINAKALNNYKEYNTNKSGNFFIESTTTNGIQQELTVVQKGDTLSTSFYSYRNNGNDSEDFFKASAQLYLDRAIYRPGQQLFFKGIVSQNKNGIRGIVPNTYFTVIINDTEYREIKKYRLKTNEFGSFTGEFTIPKNVLTGSFSIAVEEDENPEKDEKYDAVKKEHPFWDEVDFDNARINFSVEDYKRPTFEVTFNPVKSDIRLNKKAVVSGSAKSFSGAALAGAKVVYRITRSARFSGYSDFRNNYSATTELASGETTTDADGKYTIDFIAEPDAALTAESLPVFTYTVYATVTDVNGETQSANKSVFGGYHSLLLDVIVPIIINTNKNNTITFNSKNLNEEFKPVKGTITIYKIAEDKKITVSRPWASPALQTISKSDFESAFPYLPYSSINKDTIIRQKAVFTQNVNTAISKEITLNNFTGWASGKYQVLFTANDSLIESTTQFILKRDDEKYIPGNKILLTDIRNTNFIKDGYVAVDLQSSLPVLYVNVLAYSQNKVAYNDLVKVTGGKKVIKIPVKKVTSEQIDIRFDYLWQGEFTTQNQNVILNNHFETLAIEAQTMNNKLIPGDKQMWAFTVKNSNKTPAEVLASMYDASLDHFATDNWDYVSKNQPYKEHRYKYYTTEGTTFYRPEIDIPFALPFIIDDKLYTYGFNITNKGNRYWGYSPKAQLPGARPLIISGVVTDGIGMPIPGVIVTLKGTSEGTQTDFDGNYSIYANKGDVVNYRYIGMEDVEKVINESATIDITLRDDASQLDNVVVEAYRSTSRSKTNVSATVVTSKTFEGRPNANFIQTLQGQIPGLNISGGSGAPGGETTVILRGASSINNTPQPLFVIDGVPLSEAEFRNINPKDIESATVLKDASATSIYGSRGANGVIIIKTKQGEQELKALQQVTARKNFDETAFFYPQLHTDKNGKISFSFTSPEALTEWKLRLLAHNKKAVSGYFESMFVTQKELMVVPNMPRFLREKDTITIIAKVTNLTADAKTGNALLQLFDAITMQPIDNQMLNIDNLKPFTLNAKGNSTVSWKIAVPAGLQGVHYKVLAKAGDFSDGEENILPVLSNNLLVTESIPLWVKPNSSKTYTFQNLKNNNSTTLRNQGITLEYTSNPAWVALQSLPYLMEFEHECAEQVFSRYYANTIASKIISSNPKINELFETWRKQKKPLSKLEQNQELKSIIMAESPWMLDNLNAEEQKSRMALLLDLNALSENQAFNFTKLYNKQLTSGGFAWFDGGREDDYITRHILSGFGHLDKLGCLSKTTISDKLISDGIRNIDTSFLKAHKQSEKNKKNNKPLSYVNTSTSLHYLYTRSFYLKQYPLNDSLKAATKAYTEVAKQNWLNYTLYEKGLAALTLHRFGESATAKKIINSLKETSATNDENGMYWVDNKAGWQWYRAPIETQALLIEAFTEVATDIKSADAMKVWLIKNKQTKNWPTTKSTSEAVYALLMQGSDWLSVKDNTVIELGNADLLANKLAESGIEAETGYLKLSWKPEEVSKDLATVTIKNESDVPGYGGFYWQYFEDLDKIKPAQDGLMNVSKELYIKAATATGPHLKKITAGNALKIGTLVTVRLVLNIKDDVEYVHLKDLRAAAFEPVDVISSYEYKDGLGYYRSTRDAATHFFFDHINKGTYVLEYDVRVNNAGEFSNGITTLQSMYAPEFSGHTKGIRVKTVE